MSLVAATGAILAGVILGWIGYGGLALLVGIAVDRRGDALASCVGRSARSSVAPRV